MKKLIALLLALILIMIPALTTSSGESLVTPTDLNPIDPPAEPEEPDVSDEPEEDTGPPIYDFSPTLSNLNNFSIVALNNFNMQGHIRNSIWVGGTLTGESWMCVDDAAERFCSYSAIPESYSGGNK